MNLRHLITAAAIAILAVTAEGATIVVPAAGTGAGANNSQWQSELTLHTAGRRPATLAISFHQGKTVFGPAEVTVQPRATVSIEDVVRTLFGVESGSGALVIELSERDARAVAVTSRTFNTSAEGEFGQGIPATRAADALARGDIAVIPGPSSAQSSRFNVGLYAVEPTTTNWFLVRADGTVGAMREAVNHAAGEHVQYNNVAAWLGVEPRDNDTIQAYVTSGRAIFYGSSINATGDPTFIPAQRAREEAEISQFGVDLDEDGTVDIRDADGDGVLDEPIVVYTSLYPAYFRVVVEDDAGGQVDIELVSSDAHTNLLDNRGTMRVIAHGGFKGTTGEIVVRASIGTSRSLLRIPVRFR